MGVREIPQSEVVRHGCELRRNGAHDSCHGTDGDSREVLMQGYLDSTHDLRVVRGRHVRAVKPQLVELLVDKRGDVLEAGNCCPHRFDQWMRSDADALEQTLTHHCKASHRDANV